MKWFANRKISFRIMFGFLLAIFIAIVVGLVGIFSLQNVNNSYNVSYGDSAEALEILEETSNAFQRGRMNLYGLILAESRTDKEYYLGRIEEFNDILGKNIAEYKETLAGYDSNEIKDILNYLDKFSESLRKYVDKRTELIDTIAMNPAYRMEAYDELKNGDLRTLALEADDAMENIVAYEVEFAKSEIARNMASAKRITAILIGVLAIGTVIAIILALYISRGIANPINAMVDAADRLAIGDVNVKVEADTKDEVGNLAASFRGMIENIRNQAMIVERMAEGDLTVDVEIRSEEDVLGKALDKMLVRNNEALSNIASAAEQVAVGSKQVSDSSINLSEGAAEQASSVEQLTASIQEISSQIELTAQNAGNANDIAEEAKSHAASGSEQMDEMLSSMKDINESSDSISKIIKVIDEIAFQTNILALNAAVEAARAGQHGRGFAVVAEEVRNLAARSANAARETTDMIEDSIRKAEDGTKIAQATAQALNAIIGDIEKIAEIGENISLGSNEQAAGIQQINQGVMQVSEVVQNNSATSEEGAAASEELSSQAQFLREMVSNYKLKENGNGKSGNKSDELDPEVLKMLEGMEKNESTDSGEGLEDGLAAKAKIKLDDKEFGKY